MITSLLSLFITSTVPMDKAAHAGVSYGLTHATQAVCNSLTNGNHKTGCLVTGILVAGSIGAAKEVLDQKKGTNTVRQSLEDGAADVIGITTAVIFISIDF